MNLAIRLFKRLGLLLPGIFVTYIAIKGIFPEVSELIPYNPLAIFVTYFLIAYIFIPAFIRLLRIIIPAHHIPLYCTTPDGFASDPINIAVYGTRNQLVKAMAKAGWQQADKRTIRTLARLGWSLAFRKPYPTAPFSSLFLFGRSQDLGFQLPVSNNPRHRHHVRFWAASHTGDPKHIEHVSFWEKYQRSNIIAGKVLWVGAVSQDTGIGIIRHNAQLTHMIHHDTDGERDLLASDLIKTKLVKSTRSVVIGQPYRLRNRVVRGYFRADGTMKICDL